MLRLIVDNTKTFYERQVFIESELRKCWSQATANDVFYLMTLEDELDMIEKGGKHDNDQGICRAIRG